MRWINPKDVNPNWFFQYVNITLCKEFGRSEAQLLETSKEFRDDCRMYLIEKDNQEYIRQQEQQSAAKNEAIFRKLQDR